MKQRRPLTSVWLWVGIGIGAAVVVRWAIVFVVGGVDARVQVISSIGISALGIIVLFCVMLLTVAPNAARARRLALTFPGALVANARMTSSVRRLINEEGASASSHASAPILAFCVVVAEQGIEFWGGATHPQKLATIDWNRVGGISIQAVAPGINLSQAVSITLTSGEPAVSFAVASKAGLGLSLLKGQELASFAAAVVARKPAASKRPQTAARDDETRDPPRSAETSLPS
jgi:hypothetical protein